MDCNEGMRTEFGSGQHNASNDSLDFAEVKTIPPQPVMPKILGINFYWNIFFSSQTEIELLINHEFCSILTISMLTYSFCMQELELYKSELVEKPAILALNKIDMEGADELLQETLDAIQNSMCYFYSTSDNRSMGVFHKDPKLKLSLSWT